MVLFVCETPRSVFTHSVMTILVNAVYADPLVELAALSAEILVQLFAAVTATLMCVASKVTYGLPPISIVRTVV